MPVLNKYGLLLTAMIAHPGQFTSYATLAYKKKQILIDYSKNALAHPSLGFRFHTEPVSAELTAIQTAVDGMQRALLTGYVDPAVELPMFIQALKDAGLDKVKTEVEKQYTEWKAKKGM